VPSKPNVGRLWLIGLVVAPCLGLAQASEPTIVSFDLRTMRPVIEVFINGEGPFKFVLDTGATQAMVSFDLAKRLALPEIGTVMVTAPNAPGGVRAPLHHIKELKLADLKFFGVKASAILDDNFQKMLQADGVLSAQDFRGYLVTLDYRQRQLVIQPGRLPEADNKTVFDYTERHNIPGINLDVMGKSTFFHLDSGSPFYIALPGSMLTTIEYERKPQLVGTAGTIMGNFAVYYGKLTGDVTFGQHRIEKPSVEVLDKMPYGNLGYRFFRDYRVTFDYLAQRIRLEFWKDAAKTGP
jgi:hypothetical protein